MFGLLLHLFNFGHLFRGNRILLYLHLLEFLFVGSDAVEADVEGALLAAVKLTCYFKAEMAVPLSVEFLVLQFVLVVAGVKFDGSALEAERQTDLVVLAADKAPQLDNSKLMALRTLLHYCILAANIVEDMIHVALDGNAAFFINRCLHKVVRAFLAQSHPALHVEVVFIVLLQAPHAPVLILKLDFLGVFFQVQQSQLMLLMYTSLVCLDLHHFAFNAEEFLTFRALFGALFFPEAKAADVQFVNAIHHFEITSAGASVVDVSNEIPWL